MNVFILSGVELRAMARLEGPIALSSIDDGKELFESDAKFDQYSHKAPLNVNELVDFEHMNLWDDDEEEIKRLRQRMKEKLSQIDPNDPEASRKKTEHRMTQRERYLEIYQRRERNRIEQHKRILEEGESFVYTAKAPESGWYRACIDATYSEVTVEAELRKESALGGLDGEGNVITYEMKTLLEANKELDNVAASQEGIKDEDFESTAEKVKELRRLLAEIQVMQQKERRRLSLHTEKNEHSHSRMVLSSLLETLLFMAVTGYQVYTIRHWFSGAPTLGR